MEKDGISLYAAQKQEFLLFAAVQERMSEAGAGNTFSGAAGARLRISVKVKVSPSVYEYNYKIGSQIFTDPYARKIAGKRNFGEIPESVHSVRGSFSTRIYDWEGDERPRISYQDAVMYQLHVRGFTKQKNSGVRHKGTFLGLQEKLPYLKELGVNQLRLMPAYEFNELIPKMSAGVAGETEYRLIIGDMAPAFIFLQRAAYSSSAYPEEELRIL